MNSIKSNKKLSINWEIWVKWLVTPALLASLLFAGIAWFSANQPQPESRPNKIKKVRVFTHLSKQQRIQLKAVSQGEVNAVNQIEVKPQVSGNLVYVADNFVAGGVIKQGQLLVEIEPSDYQLGVTQKQAKVAQAKQQFMLAQAEAEAAKAELLSLGRNKASALALRQPQLEQAKANLAAAEAELAMAELDLTRTKIYAPFDGRVAKENVSNHQYVNKGSNIASLYATDMFEIRLPLSLDELKQIELPSAFFSSYQQSDYPVILTDGLGEDANSWQGKIVRTEANIDAKTRSIYLVAQVQNPYQNPQSPLLNGSFVYAQISGSWIEQVSALPKTALRNNGQLWVVDDNKKLKIVSAQVVQRNQNDIIVADLPQNTQVITSSLAMATDGLTVIPINANKQQKAQVTLSAAGQTEGLNNAF
ncbi:efflux RND transporter periplasmic adaptor subunit [Catenovulum agarivorans]|uniref:efflux RND transporter periplasmic adaptor subunit n=1 Tax=Catenovulum agarivorans TaxID=1172192 RepID=UPI0002E87021|nr:efflux RND transporter periplasmic adaptor subunit [Catenovulum agarivorans]